MGKLGFENKVLIADEHGNIPKIDWDSFSCVVHNLPTSATDARVRTVFAKFGSITSLTIGEVIKGGSKYATVNYKEQDSLRKACLVMDDKLLAGSRIRVREAGESKSYGEAEYERFATLNPKP
ncbi:hypothetical protein T484DRAFT_2677817 [Baffinella frigidus]|nr:hypothetical protein T484DRAFT_2677817 [Cryptophyta sp. CCMP2293]